MMLINSGASTEIRDYDGLTAYDWAEQYNRKADIEKQIKIWKKMSKNTSDAASV